MRSVYAITLLGLTGAAWHAAAQTAGAGPQAPPVAFLHGVASGDPLPDRIIIWTRITPRVDYTVFDGSMDEIDPLPQSDTYVYNVQWPVGKLNYTVEWLVSSNADLSAPVQQGSYFTNATKDWTVKVDVGGLRTGVKYYYGFRVGPAHSPVGTFRLQPAAGVRLNQLRYGVFTCSNWGWGYFNAYDYAAQLDLDLFIHVGDWLYEYGPGNYPNMAQAVRLGVFPTGLHPAHEMFKLQDYRMRHSHYRTDAGLQALMASTPLIAIWDDHEFTNDPYVGGAQNHQPANGEGDWEQRKVYAVRAYHEWMPTRSGDYATAGYIGKNITREFTFGTLATLVALEGRVTARTPQDPLAAGNTSWVPFDRRTAGITGQIPPEQWNSTITERLTALANENRAFVNNSSRQLIGPQQVAFVERAAQAPTDWILVAQTTNLHDMTVNYERAIDMIRQVDPSKAALWMEALFNVTHPNTTYRSYSSSPHLIHTLGMMYNTTPAIIQSAISQIALGRFNIISWTDSWQAHQYEREQLKEALLRPDGRAIVYSGDTHASFAGMICSGGDVVGSEYSSPGVTSPDRESSAIVPLELIGTGSMAGGGDLMWADFRYKGFQYITLTPEKHHVDWVWVTWGSPNYEVKCDSAFDYMADEVVAAQSNGQQAPTGMLQTLNIKRNMTSCNSDRFQAAACSNLPVPDRYNPAKLRWSKWAAGNDMQTSQFSVPLV